MSKRRKLTPDEQELVRQHELKKAQAAYPGATISVAVGDELDDDGVVQVVVSRSTISVIPNT